MRLDKYLKVSRIIKRRTIANEACDNGRVTVNGRVAKAGTNVNPGDVITIAFASGETRIEVLNVNEKAKKEEAGEMYKLVTSVFLACVITFGASLSLSSCTPAHKKPVTTNTEYLDIMNKDYMQALYKEACAKGYDLDIVSKESLTADILTEFKNKITTEDKEKYKDFDANDKCFELTGMTIDDYTKYSLFERVIEKYSVLLRKQLAPSEEELRLFAGEHQEECKAVIAGITFLPLKDEYDELNISLAEKLVTLIKDGQFSPDEVARGWSHADDVYECEGKYVISHQTSNIPKEAIDWVLDSAEPKVFETSAGYYVVCQIHFISIEDEQGREVCEQVYTKTKIREYAEGLVK